MSVLRRVRKNSFPRFFCLESVLGKWKTKKFRLRLSLTWIKSPRKVEEMCFLPIAMTYCGCLSKSYHYYFNPNSGISDCVGEIHYCWSQIVLFRAKVAINYNTWNSWSTFFAIQLLQHVFSSAFSPYLSTDSTCSSCMLVPRSYDLVRSYNKILFIFLKRGCPGWGANPGPLDFIYFIIFTTLPLSHSGSPLSYNQI
jgi:hypothetical protein